MGTSATTDPTSTTNPNSAVDSTLGTLVTDLTAGLFGGGGTSSQQQTDASNATAALDVAAATGKAFEIELPGLVNFYNKIAGLASDLHTHIVAAQAQSNALMATDPTGIVSGVSDAWYTALGMYGVSATIGENFPRSRRCSNGSRS